MRRIPLLSLLLLGLAALPPVAAAARAVESIALSNGLWLHLLPGQTGSQLTDVTIQVLAGSCDEQRQFAGIAHVLEHMIFLSDVGSGRSLSAELVQAGIDLRGRTSVLATTYGAYELNSDEVPDILGMFARVLLEPSYPTGEPFHRELLVVMEELRMRAPDVDYGQLDSGAGELALLSMMLGPEFPFRWNPGGFTESVTDLRRRNLAGFQRTNYRPDRMHVIVASNTPRETILEMVNRTFGAAPRPDWPSNEWRCLHFRPESFTVQPVFHANNGSCVIRLAFPAPGPDTSGGLRAELLAWLINTRFAREKKPQRSFSADVFAPSRQPSENLFFLTAELSEIDNEGQQSYDALEAGVLRLINDWRVAGPTDGEFEDARNAFALLWRQVGPNQALADVLVTGSPDTFRQLPVWLAETTAADISQTARDIFRFDRAGVVLQGKDRQRYGQEFFTSLTLFVGCVLLPPLLLLAYHFSLTRWIKDGTAVLYLARPLSRLLLIVFRTMAFLALSALVVVALLGVMHIALLFGSDTPSGIIWRSLPIALLTATGALIIHAGMALGFNRTLPAVIGSVVLFATGQISLIIQSIYQSLDRGPLAREAIRAGYRLIPKYDQLRNLAEAAILGNDPGALTWWAAGHFVLLSALFGLWGVIAFYRREFRE